MTSTTRGPRQSSVSSLLAAIASSPLTSFGSKLKRLYSLLSALRRRHSSSERPSRAKLPSFACAHKTKRAQSYTDKDFSFADAISFVVMERLGITRAFTFDRHFEQYGFTVLTPDTIEEGRP